MVEDSGVEGDDMFFVIGVGRFRKERLGKRKTKWTCIRRGLCRQFTIGFDMHDESILPWMEEDGVIDADVVVSIAVVDRRAKVVRGDEDTP